MTEDQIDFANMLERERIAGRLHHVGVTVASIVRARIIATAGNALDLDAVY